MIGIRGSGSRSRARSLKGRSGFVGARPADVSPWRHAPRPGRGDQDGVGSLRGHEHLQPAERRPRLAHVGRREDGAEAQGEGRPCRARSRARGARTRARSRPGSRRVGGALWFWRRKSSDDDADAARRRELERPVSLFRAALDGLVPYEPGKPEEEVQRELGLERVVKLASNEGPWGPFPAALEALERSAPLAQPLSRRRRLPPPQRARRAARGRPGERDHRRRRGRRDRAPLGGDARPRRRGRDRAGRRSSATSSTRSSSARCRARCRSSTTTTTSTRCSRRSGRGRSSSTSRPRTTRPGR